MPYTPPTGPFVTIDIWKAKFFPYNTEGKIDLPGYPVPATTPYEGLELQKVKTLAPNLGAPRQIPVPAQGTVQTTFNLPSLDPQTIEAHLAYADLNLYAEMTGVKARTILGTTVVPIGTNKVGFEKKGILLVNSLQAHLGDDDSDVWFNYVFTSAKATFQWFAMNENPTDVTVNFALGKKKKAVWGEAFSEEMDGASNANGHGIISYGQLNLVAWLADGSEDTFLLPEDKPALDSFADTFGIFDTDTGDPVTGTPAADQFVAGSAPTTDHRLLGYYQTISGV